MATISSVFDIAKNALQANQKAIGVTSHNIANANTPGYSRQRAVFESTGPVNFGGLFFGTGVDITNIQRIYDRFQATQIMNAASGLTMYEKMSSMLQSLEGLFSEPGEGGLGSQIEKFFNGFLDVANNPTSYADRSALLSSANSLTQRINSIDSSIRLALRNINSELSLTVTRLNGLAEEVADLNARISTIDVAGLSANDLKDKREAVLKEIAGLADIKVMEHSSGQVDVFVGGVVLVAGVKTSPLEVSINNDNPDVYNVVSEGVVLNGRLTGGAIKGLLDSASEYQSVQSRLDVLSVSIVRAVNIQHRLGYGLDGSTTGLDFFSAPLVYAKANVGVTGGAGVTSASVTDLSALTLDDYEIRFSGPGAYNVVNLSTGAIAASGAYTSGGAITFDGLSVIITDNTGAPAAGDTFLISTTRNASGNMGVALTDPNKIAAAGAPSSTGDNTNALALASLKNSARIDGSTFRDYYAGLMTDLGIAAGEAESEVKSHNLVLEQLEIAREAVSGVSLEEEAVELIKLQRAYEAAAKVMTTADKMLEVLLNIR